MTTFADLVKRAAHLWRPETSGIDNINFALRNRKSSVTILPTADANHTICLMVAEKDCTLVSATFNSDAGLTSDATNYWSAALKKDDGAGGAATTFHTLGGQSTAITADQLASFTIDESTDTLDEGDRLVLVLTKAGTGPAYGALTVDVVYRLD